MDSNRLLSDLAQIIRAESALGVFAARRAKFEGWLKVAIVRLLEAQGFSPTPEQDRVDVVCGDQWAIQLKTANTNYRHPNVRNVIRPITKNVAEIIEDIEKLKLLPRYDNRAVLFVVFPCKPDHVEWVSHLGKISPNLKRLQHLAFEFSNGVPAIAYFGEV